ncbi:Tungsten-containing formylmethanofuran dehydrogenase, subunit B [Granulibacter bethesdensis]|nr:Tungsten-containing formylmethanofuran dehydrogenase, subunit B [Granulibacter bethesdensis]
MSAMAIRDTGDAAGALAWIDGREASLDDAVDAAVELLREGRSPAIGGLATDLKGLEAAVALAEAVGGTLDHAASEAAFRDLDLLRETGLLTVTPLQVRAQAQTVVLVGDGVEAIWPSFAADLALDEAPTIATHRGERQIIRIGAASGSDLKVDEEELPVILGTLRAAVAGRTVRLPAARLKAVQALAETLKASSYGVILWSSETLDALSVEMLGGLVNDLNAATRFAALPVAGPGNVQGAIQTVAGITGLPPRLGFGRGRAEHDPWRFDLLRLIDEDETDCLLWIDALDYELPPDTPVPVIALTSGDEAPEQAAVAFAVGQPGVDHDAILFAGAVGGQIDHPASAAAPRSARPDVATILGRIRAAYEAG